MACRHSRTQYPYPVGGNHGLCANLQERKGPSERSERSERAKERKERKRSERGQVRAKSERAKERAKGARFEFLGAAAALPRLTAADLTTLMAKGPKGPKGPGPKGLELIRGSCSSSCRPTATDFRCRCRRTRRGSWKVRSGCVSGSQSPQDGAAIKARHGRPRTRPERRWNSARPAPASPCRQ